jgi:DNA-binding CsgD family transcriptional regulator
MTPLEFSALLDVLAIGIVIHDEQGRCVHINEAAMGLRAAARTDVDRSVRAALGERNIAVASGDDSMRICSIPKGPKVYTFLFGPGQVNIRLSACMFDLTPAEENVAAQLASGKTTRQIASAAGTSLHTIHSHLKNMFAKTETRSQNELIALLGGLAQLAVHEVRSLSPSSRRRGRAKRLLRFKPELRAGKNTRSTDDAGSRNEPWPAGVRHSG